MLQETGTALDSTVANDKSTTLSDTKADSPSNTKTRDDAPKSSTAAPKSSTKNQVGSDVEATSRAINQSKVDAGAARAAPTYTFRKPRNIPDAIWEQAKEMAHTRGLQDEAASREIATRLAEYTQHRENMEPAADKAENALESEWGAKDTSHFGMQKAAMAKALYHHPEARELFNLIGVLTDDGRPTHPALAQLLATAGQAFLNSSAEPGGRVSITDNLPTLQPIPGFARRV